MAKPIKITVRGTDSLGDDAPTVEDLLSQIQDFVSVLHGVEDVIAGNGKEEIIWRVTDASRNSPLTFEITPYPRNHAMNIDKRASEVVKATALGFNTIETKSERPIFFSDQVIQKAEKVYERVTDGLAGTQIDFSAYEDAPSLDVDKQTARQSLDHITQFRTSLAVPHRELGSLEGFITKVELDGFRRPIVWLKSRVDGQIVKCVAKGDGLDRIGHLEVVEVLKGLRVRVYGLLSYKSLEEISRIDVDGVHVFEPDDELPDASAIVSPGFTGGVEASEYLDALHDNS